MFTKSSRPEFDTGGEFTTMMNLGVTPPSAPSTNDHMMFGDPLDLQNVSALHLDQLVDAPQPNGQVQDHSFTAPGPSFATNNFIGAGSSSGSEVIHLDNSESESANILNGFEIETKIWPEATVAYQDNHQVFYSLILPDNLIRTSEGWFLKPDDNENGFVNNISSSPPLENIAVINIGENCESSSFNVHPSSLVDATPGTSGILTEHSVPLNSDDTKEDFLTQDNGNEDGEETAVYTAGVFDNTTVVDINHEEVIDLNNGSQINSESDTLNIESLISASELVSEGRSHDAYNDFQEAGTVVADPTQYFMPSDFPREEVTVVYDSADGSQGHTQQVLVEEQQQLNYPTQTSNYEHEQDDLNFDHQENNHDSSSSISSTTTADSLEGETDDPDWSLSNDECDPPKKKRRRKSERSNQSNTKDSRNNSKRQPKRGIRKQGDSKPSGQGTTNKGRKHNDKNSSSIISQGTPDGSSGSGHCRTKTLIDKTSFRFTMAPHLRALSAILEMSGMKYFSANVTHDVIGRFPPCDVYRTIEKSIQSQADWKVNTTGDVEPDWQKMESNTEPIDWESKFNGGQPKKTTNLDAETLARIYYSSPFGSQNGGSDCVISIRKEAEENGKLKDSPEVLAAIGSAELNVTLDLHIVAENCANTEFKKVGDDDFEIPLLIQLKRPQCTGILYKCGKIVVIGIKSYEEFRTAVRRLARMVQKIDENVRLTNLKLHFYVGLITLPFCINVMAMRRHEYLSKFISYNSRMFPGVVIKAKDSPILCMVFNSGTVIMTEARGAAELKSTLDKIYPTLRLFGYQA